MDDMNFMIHLWICIKKGVPLLGSVHFLLITIQA